MNYNLFERKGIVRLEFFMNKVTGNLREFFIELKPTKIVDALLLQLRP